MKISFWYKDRRYYLLLRNYHSLWEILHCLEKQYGENEMNVEYNKFVEENLNFKRRRKSWRF